MKRIFIFFIFSSTIFSNDFFERLKVLEDKVSCQNQYNIKQKQKQSKKNLQEYLICIDSRVQYSEDKIINEQSIKVIQIFLTSNRRKAKKIVEEYNFDKKELSLLNKSKAYFLERDIVDRSILKNGKYYKIIIFQDNINVKKLLRNFKKIFKKNYKDAFIINISVREVFK